MGGSWSYIAFLSWLDADQAGLAAMLGTSAAQRRELLHELGVLAAASAFPGAPFAGFSAEPKGRGVELRAAGHELSCDTT